MEYKINTELKKLTIMSEMTVDNLLKTIYNLSEANIIDNTWTISSEPSFTYSYPILMGACTGNCNGTGCTCKINTTLTTN